MIHTLNALVFFQLNIEYFDSWPFTAAGLPRRGAAAWQ
jgi:hypothetical protein